MTKITFLGAGSTIFVRRILGDAFLYPSLQDSEIALYDIDKTRLEQSKKLINSINERLNASRATIKAYLGVENRRLALEKSDYVINAIQVGGYEPATVIDFEIPKKYGLRQTIGDTLGIGGIFRGLRTIPVLFEIASDMEIACPDAWFLNYSNPMAILTGAMLTHTNIKTVGLCHSVQVCADTLLKNAGFSEDVKKLRWKIAGINHMAWLLEIKDGKKDLYPQLRRLVKERNGKALADNNHKHSDMVRFEMLNSYGYYVTESSEHNCEYIPHWLKANYPELVDTYNIPLDEYPRRCREQLEQWKQEYQDLLDGKAAQNHEETEEYAAKMLNAMEENVINHGCIANLPSDCVVEIPCLVDGNGVQGCYVGRLPEQCAALNMTNINAQKLTIKAAITRKKEHIYQAAMLDPVTSSFLPVDKIRLMCDDLIEAHGRFMEVYR
jgi:alpha-galactosidase